MLKIACSVAALALLATPTLAQSPASADDSVSILVRYDDLNLANPAGL